MEGIATGSSENALTTIATMDATKPLSALKPAMSRMLKRRKRLNSLVGGA
jgi:hypothetical protein